MQLASKTRCMGADQGCASHLNIKSASDSHKVDYCQIAVASVSEGHLVFFCDGEITSSLRPSMVI